MLLKKTIAFLFLLPLVAFGAKPIKLQELEIPLEQLTPKQSISLFAQQYGASEKELLTVAMCESKLNPNAFHKNDGGVGKHSVGIFQYQYSTFLRMEKVMGEDLDYYSYQDQAKLTAYMYANHPEVKREWTCHRINYKRLS